jgi:hypothetical protein
MYALKLNIVELLEIVRVCGSLRVEKCPASDLRDYLAVHLGPLNPELADKVRRWNEVQLETLSRHVQKLQNARQLDRAHDHEEVVSVR